MTHVLDDHLKERLQIFSQVCGSHPCDALDTGCVDHREVALVIFGTQIHEQLKGGVNHPLGTCGRAINLVHHHHNLQATDGGMCRVCGLCGFIRWQNVLHEMESGK